MRISRCRRAADTRSALPSSVFRPKGPKSTTEPPSAKGRLGRSDGERRLEQTRISRSLENHWPEMPRASRGPTQGRTCSYEPIGRRRRAPPSRARRRRHPGCGSRTCFDPSARSWARSAPARGGFCRSRPERHHVRGKIKMAVARFSGDASATRRQSQSLARAPRHRGHRATFGRRAWHRAPAALAEKQTRAAITAKAQVRSSRGASRGALHQSDSTTIRPCDGAAAIAATISQASASESFGGGELRNLPKRQADSRRRKRGAPFDPRARWPAGPASLVGFVE